MRIGSLVRTTFEHVHPHEGVSSIDGVLLEQSFVVVADETGFVGILSAEDLVRSPRSLVADCLQSLPIVDFDDDVGDVLERMRTERVKALPVFRDGMFYGVCVRSDVAEFLENRRQDLEEDLAKRTAVLKTEVHARREAEEALRQSEARYREIVETVSEGVWILDSEGRTAFVNAHAAESVGGEPNGMMGRLFASFVMVDDRQGLAAALADAKRGRPRRIQLRLRGPGEARWFSASITRRRRAEGGADGTIAMLADITDEKRLEEVVFRAQKMEAIGTMAAGIAHDINNVLTPIMGHAELIVLRKGGDAVTHAKQILDAAGRIREVSRRLLTLSRQQPQSPRPTDLHAVVAEGMQLLRASLPTTIEVKELHASDAAVVKADATQLHQILLNLCANAQHAMRSSGGVLEVEVDRVVVSEDDPITPGGPPPGSYGRLTVRDTGIGMPPEVRKRMFEPYFTTRERGEGSGLGLAVVDGIVSAFGGFLTVESEAGEGTSIAVWLPVTDESTSRIEPPSPRPRGGTERILAVDDEAAVLDVCTQVLSELGYRVTGTENCLRALELLQADPAAFDLLLVDETMPHMSGLELAEEVRKLRPGLPVVVMSGGGFSVGEATNISSVADELLVKPFAAGALLETVRRVLDGTPSVSRPHQPFRRV